MAEYRFGFIGTGNMGGALAKAVGKSVSGESIIIADKDTKKAETMAEGLNCVAGTNTDAAEKSQYLFLGVKPQILPALIEEIRPVLSARNDRFVLVSMAAGVTVSKILSMLGEKYPVIRIMPNTPVSVGEGMIEYAVSDDVTPDETDEFCKALANAGKLDNLDEELMDAATALAGSGPAFVYLFAEALAEGGVACGLTKEKALKYASQTLKGAAVMLMSSDKQPGELTDAVCSPGGTTIEGVRVLQNSTFHDTVMQAVTAAYKRAKEL